TFESRPSQYQPVTGARVYLLGHEELQIAASRYFGQRLESYRDRLHEWASEYQAKEWPTCTPEYLLGGYYRLLEVVGDLPRMIACAIDAARHDRILDLTGGDTAALAEVRTVLERIAYQDAPDLASALALAFRRDQLISRNAHIPVDLPAVWVRI